jgi:WD40 repeat protein
MSGQAGRQFDSLAALRKAAAIQPSLTLRNEAIASMVLPDIRLSGEKDFSRQRGSVTADAAFENYAVRDRAGIVSVRRMSDARELSRLPWVGPDATPATFSPDGKWLAVAYADDRLRVWDWARPALILDVIKEYTKGDLNFASDSRQLGISDSTNIVLYDLAKRGSARAISLNSIGGALQTPSSFRFDPSGRRLAVVGAERTNVLVLDVDSGNVLNSLPHRETILGFAWHPDGRVLATAGADTFIRIWDVATGERLRAFQVDQAVSVAFNREGNILVSSGWDGKTRLFEFPSVRPQVSIYKSGNVLGFGPDDRTLGIVAWDGGAVLLFEVAPSRGLRVVREREEGTSGSFGGAVFDSRGVLLAYPVAEGVRLWDSRNHKEIGFLAAADKFPTGFDAGQENLLVGGPEGLLRCAVTKAQAQGTIDLGAPQLVIPLKRPHHVVSPDGKFCALGAESRWRILRTDTFTEMARTGTQRGTAHAAFSPDGKLLATSAFHFPGVKVWNAQNGELVKELPADDDLPDPAPTVAFSADGRRLVVATREEFCFWEVASWSLARRIPQPPEGSCIASMAFSRDGKIFAGTHHGNVVRLYDAPSGQPLADLEAPNSRQINSLEFNSDGTQLVACQARDALRVWDLRVIRQQLAGMGLDWDQPPYRPAQENPAASK